MSSLYIPKLLSCSTDLLFCVMNVLSFFHGLYKRKDFINLDLPGEFIDLENTYEMSALYSCLGHPGMKTAVGFNR